MTRYEPDALGNTRSITDPVGRRANFGFDALGNVIWAEDFSGAKTVYGYDDNWRLTRIVTPSDDQVQCRYDDRDRLVCPFGSGAQVDFFMVVSSLPPPVVSPR